MSRMFLFRCKLSPVAGGPQEHLGGGYAGVWVWTDSADRVETAALDYLGRHGWAMVEQQGHHEVSLEKAQADPLHHANFLKAQRNGVAAEISTFTRPARQ